MGQFPNLSPFLVSPCVREPVSVQTALHNIPRAQFPEIPLVGWFSINQCRAHVRGNRWCFQVASDSLQWTVLDLWSPKEKISLWDQRLSFSHSELCFITVKMGERKLWHRHQKGTESAPMVWVGLYILFQLVTNNRSKEYLKVVKVLPGPLPQHIS